MATVADFQPSGTPTITTAYEDSNETSITLHAGLETFIDQIRGFDQVEVDVIGKSNQGRNIYAFRVGYPQAPTYRELRDARCIMKVSCIHGNEEATTEPDLMLIRDFCEGRLTATANTYFQNNPMIFVPSANPDGRDNHTRENSDNVDPNRDFMAFNTLEARALLETMSEVEPILYFDAHESSAGIMDNTNIRFIQGRNLNCDSGIRNEGDDLTNIWLIDYFQGLGYTADRWPDKSTPNRGGGSTSFYPALYEVVETALDKNLNLSERVNLQRLSLERVLHYFSDRKSALVGLVDTAKVNNTETGYNSSDTFDLDGGNSTGVILNPTPIAYKLTQAQFDTLKFQIDNFKIEYEPALGGGYYLHLNQEKRAYIPILCDSQSEFNVVSATALAGRRFAGDYKDDLNNGVSGAKVVALEGLGDDMNDIKINKILSTNVTGDFEGKVNPEKTITVFAQKKDGTTIQTSEAKPFIKS